MELEYLWTLIQPNNIQDGTTSISATQARSWGREWEVVGCCIPSTTVSQEEITKLNWKQVLFLPSYLFVIPNFPPIFLLSSFFSLNLCYWLIKIKSWFLKLSVMVPEAPTSLIIYYHTIWTEKINPLSLFPSPLPQNQKNNLYISWPPVQIKPGHRRRDLERGARPFQRRFKEKLHKEMNCWTQSSVLKTHFIGIINAQYKYPKDVTEFWKMN